MTNKQVSIGILIFIFTLIMGFCVWHISHKQRIYTAEEQQQINAQKTSRSTDLIFTEQEQRDIAKWKNKSLDDLVNDAHEGDAAALWLIGGYFFYGFDGFPLNTDMAYEYFEKSASLGFAPAINDLAQRYFTDGSNPFLGLVYKNLTIASGHQEFVLKYHELVDTFIRDDGKAIIQEIERIAARKMAIILRNRKNHVSSKCVFDHSFNSITKDDFNYDSDFFIDIYLDKIEFVEFSQIQGSKDEPYFDELYKFFDSAISANTDLDETQVLTVYQKMADAGYSQTAVKKLVKQVIFLTKSNHKYICDLEKKANASENKIAVLDALKAGVR